MDMLGTQHFVLCREVVLFRRLFCIECYVLLVCPLLGGLSSFGVSFIGGYLPQPSRKRGSVVEASSVEQVTPGVNGGGASGGSDGVEEEGLGGSETRIDRPPSAKAGRIRGHGSRGTRPSIDSNVTIEESLTHGPAPPEGGGATVPAAGGSGETQTTAAPQSPSPPAPTQQGPMQGMA